MSEHNTSIIVEEVVNFLKLCLELNTLSKLAIK